MKRFAAVVVFLAMSVPAQAGVMEWVSGRTEDGVWGLIGMGITVIFGALSALGLAKWARWKKVALELKDVVQIGIKAKSPDSDGGKEVTKSEWDVLLDEADDVVRAAVYAAIGIEGEEK